MYTGCTQAEMGCVEDKQLLSDGINKVLEPFRERRKELASRKGFVEEVLEEGARRARSIAINTLTEVREKMGVPEVGL